MSKYKIVPKKKLRAIRDMAYAEGLEDGERQERSRTDERAETLSMTLAAALFLLARGDVKVEMEEASTEASRVLRTKEIRIPRGFLAGNILLRQRQEPATDCVVLQAINRPGV